MGINTQNVAYSFGQMGSANLKSEGVEMFAPRGKVIVSITMLEAVKFEKLTPDTSHATGSATVDNGPSDTAFFGIATQVAANGGDGEAGGYNQALADAVDHDIVFPAELTIFGRWTSVELADYSDPDSGTDDYTHGIMVYYGV